MRGATGWKIQGDDFEISLGEVIRPKADVGVPKGPKTVPPWVRNFVQLLLASVDGEKT